MTGKMHMKWMHSAPGFELQDYRTVSAIVVKVSLVYKAYHQLRTSVGDPGVLASQGPIPLTGIRRKQMMSA